MTEYRKYIHIAFIAFIFYLAAIYWNSFVALIATVLQASTSIVLAL